MAATEANPRVTPVHKAGVFCLYFGYVRSLGFKSTKKHYGKAEFMF